MKPRIGIVCTSLGETSRSRTTARYIESLLIADERVAACRIDVRQAANPFLPGALDILGAALRECDAFVLCTPVHHWSASPLTWQLLGQLRDTRRDFRPFMVVGGAGSRASVLAFDGLCRAILMETDGIQVGAPIVCAADDADLVLGTLAEALRCRIARSLRELAQVALNQAAR